MIDNIKIYFDPIAHKYTDEFGNKYTSTTTIIGKYYEEFDTKRMARICAQSGMRGNPKYAGKTAAQLEHEWAENTKKACDKGSLKHDYLEQCIKDCNGYRKIEGSFTNGRMYTIFDVMNDESLGRIYPDDLESHGIREKYPTIYNFLIEAINKGYRLHSEVSVYNPYLMCSGMIDLFLIKGYDFIVCDWKTNQSPIKFESGYFAKDNNGNITDNFILTNKYFFRPLNHLVDSVGNHYTLQLSVYDYQAEQYGLQCKGNVLFHIRDIDNKEVVNVLNIKYLRDDAYNMLNHHRNTLVTTKQMRIC